MPRKRTLMNQITENIIDQIQAGMEEKKGRDIVIVDLSGITDVICQAFVICTGNSPSHVQALTDSVEEFAREKAGEKPVRIAGRENATWVAMDYTDVMVHVFVPDMREYYSLESLWQDAPIEAIPDLS